MLSWRHALQDDVGRVTGDLLTRKLWHPLSGSLPVQKFDQSDRLVILQPRQRTVLPWIGELDDFS